VQLGNATEAPQRLQLSASGLEGLRVASDTEVSIDAAADRWIVVRLQAPYGVAPAGSYPVQLDVHSPDGSVAVQARTTFLVPR
jgi:hypothetical protein